MEKNMVARHVQKPGCSHWRADGPMCPTCTQRRVQLRKEEKAREDALEVERLEQVRRNYQPIGGRAPAMPLDDRPLDFGRHLLGEPPPQPLNFDRPYSIGRRFTGGRDIEDFVQDPEYAGGPRRRRR